MAASPTGNHPGLGKRLAAMARAWLVLGIVVGLHNGLRTGGGVIAMAAFLVAGLLVLPCVGLLLAPFTGRAKESLLGAACGALVGLASGPLRGNLPPGEAVNLALIIGGLVGATCWPWVRGLLWAAGLASRAVQALHERLRHAAHARPKSRRRPAWSEPTPT